VGVIHHNIATATGTPPALPDGTFPPKVTATDTAFAHVKPVAPAITLRKFINGVAAGITPGVLVPVGSNMAVTFVVTNTGNVDLNPVVVTDNTIAASAISCPNTKLVVGASETCTAKLLAPAVGVIHHNIATATGTPPALPDGTFPPKVTATDTAFAHVQSLVVIHPLANTGFSVAGPLTLGSLLLILGGAGIVLGRRRRDQQSKRH